MANRGSHYSHTVEKVAALGFFFLLAAQSHGIAASDQKREGGVLDWLTHKPVVAAEVSAWMGESKAPKGDCPTFTKLIDQGTTRADGVFFVSIDSGVRAYDAVFCSSGYFPRTERQIDSESNGKVQPFPVRLYPRSSDATTFKATTKETVRRFVSDISYLAQSRPDAFREAVEEMRKSEILGPKNRPGLDMFLENAPHVPAY
ncbi:MAG: hypothetical protein WAM82_00845 [Thermoanaerobaculia bacterium]